MSVPRTYYATLDGTIHGTMTRLGGILTFFTDNTAQTIRDEDFDRRVLLHGNVALCEAQAIFDRHRLSPCHRTRAAA